MKEFKEFIKEVRAHPANSNAHNDSDHDMVDIADEAVVRRLNSFLGVVSEIDHPMPEQTISIVRRRLANIGLQFEDVKISDDESGKVSVPLTQFGGRFGKDTDGSDINDDGISHKKEGGLKIEVSHELLQTGTSKVYAKLV